MKTLPSLFFQRSFNVISGYFISAPSSTGRGEEVFDVKQHTGERQPSQPREQLQGPWGQDSPDPLLFSEAGPATQAPQGQICPEFGIKTTRCPGRPPSYLRPLGRVPESFLASVTWFRLWGGKHLPCATGPGERERKIASLQES